MIEQIKQAMEAMGFDNAGVETIKVPAGSTISDAMIAKGYKPKGDRCSCGEQHVWSKTMDDGEELIGYAMPMDREEHDAVPPKAPPAQQRALTSLDARIEEIEKALAIMKKLRASISQPLEDRTPTTTIEEVMLALQLKGLLG